MIEIKLLNGADNAHQRFSIRLGVNLLEFEIDYLSYTESPAWSMNILRDGSPIILGAMLEPNAEVSKCYDAKIGRFFFVGEAVTLDNLGVDNKLIWLES